MGEYTSHYSVLLKEVLEAFEKQTSTQKYFGDMTFGGGGHSFAIAESFAKAHIFSVDQDNDALENGYKLIKERGKSETMTLVKMNFHNFPKWFEKEHSDKKLDGIVMDLGVSSHHFDDFERGFSFREDAFLDMRMNQDDGEFYTAAEVLNELDEESLANMIFKYGEERYSRRIAKAIVGFRKDQKLERTKDLENICFHAYPANLRHKKIHPATKTFQALRIFVNRELEVLENSLENMFHLLSPGGVLAIISFHSLEDRIVKHKFKEIFQSDKNAAKIITKKPIYPSEQELEENSRSRSAKLRLLQKID